MSLGAEASGGILCVGGSIMGIPAKLSEDFNGYQLGIKVYGKRKKRWNSCNIGFGKDEQNERESAEKFAVQAKEAIKVWC